MGAMYFSATVCGAKSLGFKKIGNEIKPNHPKDFPSLKGEII
jgi:hypothetical protein